MKFQNNGLVKIYVMFYFFSGMEYGYTGISSSGLIRADLTDEQLLIQLKEFTLKVRIPLWLRYFKEDYGLRLNRFK
jgi:hypothetical protein